MLKDQPVAEMEKLLLASYVVDAESARQLALARAVLVRDAADPLLFAGLIFFDVAAFEREQAQRRELIQSTRDEGAALFEGRALAATEPFTYSGTATGLGRERGRGAEGRRL